MTPIAAYFFTSWLRQRELNAIYREIETSDPNWRWRDLIAKPPGSSGRRRKLRLAGAEWCATCLLRRRSIARVVLNTKARPTWFAG